MSEHMRIQSELNTDLEVYRLKGELLELREQNQVLREALEIATQRLNEGMHGVYDTLFAHGGDPGIVALCKAALTATSQPVSKKGDYPHHPAFDEYGEHR